MYLIPVVGFVIGVVIGLCAYVVDEFMKRTTRALAMIQKGIALKDIQDRGDPPEYSENEEISEMSKIPHEMLLVTVKDSDNNHPLFYIRNGAWYKESNRTVIIETLKACRKMMRKGQHVYGTLGQFYESLGYTTFNYFVVLDMSVYEPMCLKSSPVFCVGDKEFSEDDDDLTFGSALTSHFNNL